MVQCLLEAWSSGAVFTRSSGLVVQCLLEAWSSGAVFTRSVV